MVGFDGVIMCCDDFQERGSGCDGGRRGLKSASRLVRFQKSGAKPSRGSSSAQSWTRRLNLHILSLVDLLNGFLSDNSVKFHHLSKGVTPVSFVSAHALVFDGIACSVIHNMFVLILM